MRIVTIEGGAATGKTIMLGILADHAARKPTQGDQLCSMIRMHKKGAVKLALQLSTFVDEVTDEQEQIIRDFVAESYPSNEYVIVMVRASHGFPA